MKLLSKLQLSHDFQDNNEQTKVDPPGGPAGVPTSSHALRMAALSELQNSVKS